MCMLTGARLGEVRCSRFEHFNLENLTWTKPASMTKQRKIHRLPISEEVAAIEGPDAAIDIRDLRTLLASLRMARRTAWQTTVRLITTGMLLALIAGVAVKLKIFGIGE